LKLRMRITTMAKILEHPNHGDRPNEVMFRYTDGVVRIAVPEGEILSIERANMLMDMVKADLLDELRVDKDV